MSTIVLSALLMISPLAQQADQPQDTPAEQIEMALGEDRYLAEDARNRFIEAFAQSTRAALRDTDRLDVLQRQKLHHLIDQAQAQVRWDLAVSQLPTADRAVAEKYYKRNRERVWTLFGTVRDARIAAIEALPRERAAVPLVMLMDDNDYEVANAALTAAMNNGGPIVGRGAARYLAEICTLADNNFFADKEPAIEIVVGQMAHKLIRIIGNSKHSEAMPTVSKATRYFAQRFDTNMWPLPPVFTAIAQLKDPQAAPLLLPFLRQPGTILRSGTGDDGRRLTRFLSDAALQALLEMHDLPLADYGFISAGKGIFYGFPSEDARKQALDKFNAWYAKEDSE